MAEKLKESKRVLTIRVEFLEFETRKEWPEVMAYLFTNTGRMISQALVEPDPEKKGIGLVNFKVTDKYDNDRLTVKFDTELEDIKSLSGQRQLSYRLRELKKIKNIYIVNIAKLIWICWLKKAYLVTGTVEKQVDSEKQPVCIGEVDIFDVDVRCFYRLSDTIIERLRLSIIDLILDPPPFELPDLKEFPQWWDDDDWCGTPPGPRPPLGKDTLSKIQQLPREWAFAKCRVEAADTARSRLDETFSTMSMSKKQGWLSSEIAGDVRLSQVVYSNTQQFRTLLVDKFQVFRYWLCWYPWIHWLWWPWCKYYGMQKIGTATLQLDGSFSEIIWISVCNKDTPDLWFRVRQSVDAVERVIYARYPVLCNTYWNHPSGAAVNLMVTDPNAVACDKGEQVDKDGIFVMPMGVGNNGWYDIEQAHLKPGDTANSDIGLYDATDPYGTQLHLRMKFHEDLQTRGVHYYRWSYAPAGTINWTYINTPIAHRYMTKIGLDYFIVPEDLGPFVVGTTTGLFKIPDPAKDWIGLTRRDRAFALWNTATWDSDLRRYVNKIADGLYTLQLEMFDAAGNLLDPTATGAGWTFFLPTADAVGGIWPVDNAPHIQAGGGVLFNIRVNNSDTIADIQSVGLGSSSTGECQFIEYTDPTTDNVTIRYRAYHRQPPARDFLLSYSISVKRGISGTTVASYSSATPTHVPATLTRTVADLLRQIGAKGPYTRCSFAVELHTYPRTRNGFSRIRDYEDHDTSAFALMAK